MSKAPIHNAMVLVIQGSAQLPKTTEFKSYLEYELTKGDPARIQCLYERSMKENCLVGDMWTDYTSYLVRKVCFKNIKPRRDQRVISPSNIDAFYER